MLAQRLGSSIVGASNQGGHPMIFRFSVYGRRTSLRSRASRKLPLETGGCWPGTTGSNASLEAAARAFLLRGPALAADGPLMSSGQISVCSEISRASSTSMPRYGTVDSSFECPSSN